MTVVGNVQLYSENVDAADGANNDTPCHLHHNEREIANTSFSLRDLSNEILQHIFDFIPTSGGAASIGALRAACNRSVY